VTFAAFVICALTILIPTTLMGGTLPVLARYMIESESRIGHHIARLYYLNSFGAVFGSVIGGFFLIPKLGLPYTMYAAAFLNIEVALAAFLLSAIEANSSAKDDSSTPTTAESAAPSLAPDLVAGPLSAARIALIVIGISGFVSFVYEVAWIRLLTLVLGTSSFSFSIMLAAFIFGITLGSFVLSRKKTEEGYFRILGWCEIAIGLSALLSLLFYHRLPYILNQWRSMLASEDTAYPLYQFGAFVLCFAAMVLPTIFIGATVPAASRVVARDLPMLGRRIGSVFAINTAGTLLGAFCAGFLLLPHLGIRHMIELAAGLNLLLGLWVVLADRSAARSFFFRKQVAVGLCVVLPIVFVSVAPDWDKGAFTGGAYRLRKRYFTWKEFEAANAKNDIVFYADGKDASIAVTKTFSTIEQRDVLSLRINGKPDASDGRDMITQSLVGHLPMLLHPAPKDVLVIGLGSGVTAGAASLYPGAKITVIELIPEVIEASKLFRHVNSNVLQQPNVQLVIQDAKTFMQLGEQKYDVIILEPTNPWIAGVAGLFSQEFLGDARSRLKEGGILLQWMHLYEMEDQAFWSVLRTFNEIYPYSTLFNLGGTDMAFIGSPTPFDPDFARIGATIKRTKR
jgi:spermidine synthase